MKKPGYIKRSIKKHFDIMTWMDVRQLKNSWEFVSDLYRLTFKPKPKLYTESFSDMAQRYGLDEKELSNRRRNFLKLTVIFVLFALPVFGYAIYLFHLKKWDQFFITFVIALMSLGQAFRYHFWAYQIQQRRLGCTFKEWYRSFF